MPRINRAQLLVKKGFFPRQLPPAFHTEDLAAHFDDLVAAWTPDPDGKPKRAKWELFSVARAGHFRRTTALVNPVPQTLLCAKVDRYWGKLVKHYRSSGISASHPRFVADGTRAASVPPMRPLYERRLLMSAGYKYVLQTDVSRFFPTIYTHSIPWALHTKQTAKRNRKHSDRYFGNILDAAVQDCQDGQTLGLPIGPDTSHVIAEAVITAADTALRKSLGGKPIGLRYVDDYYLFFASQADAEKALGALSRVLREIELQVNFDKTSIRQVWDACEDSWTHELRGHEISSVPRRQRGDLNKYFEFLKRLARENKDENVTVYGLKRATDVLIRPDNWGLFESHVCHAAMASPNALDYVARIFTTYSRLSYPLDKAKIARMCDQVIRDHAPLSHDSEVAWALSMCRDLNIDVSVEAVRVVSRMHSSVCALLLLHLEALGKTSAPVDLSYWKSFRNSTSLWEDLWLLSYEAGVRGWGGFTEAHVAADPHFNELRLRNVRFYDEGRTLSPIFRVQQDAPIGPAADVVDSAFFDREDAEDYLVFEEDDGGYGSVIASSEEDEEDLF